MKRLKCPCTADTFGWQRGGSGSSRSMDPHIHAPNVLELHPPPLLQTHLIYSHTQNTSKSCFPSHFLPVPPWVSQPFCPPSLRLNWPLTSSVVGGRLLFPRRLWWRVLQPEGKRCNDCLIATFTVSTTNPPALHHHHHTHTHAHHVREPS